MQTDIEFLQCPNCGAKVGEIVRHNGFRAATTSIGLAMIRCGNCGTEIRTGQSEWQDKSILQRAWYVVSRALWWGATSLMLGAPAGWIVMLLAEQAGLTHRGQREGSFAVLFSLLAALIGALYIRQALVEIGESRRRTAA